MAIPGGSSGPGSLQSALGSPLPLGSVRIWGRLAGGLQRPYHFLPLDVSPCVCGHWLSHFVGQQPCYLSCPQVSPSCAISPTLGLAEAFTARESSSNPILEVPHPLASSLVCTLSPPSLYGWPLLSLPGALSLFHGCEQPVSPTGPLMTAPHRVVLPQ